MLGSQLERKIKIGVNERIKIAENCVRDGGVKVGRLLIKSIKFITINLGFKRNFFSN